MLTKPTTVSVEPTEVKILHAQVKDLKKSLKEAEGEALTAEMIRRKIFQIADTQPEPPQWVLEPKRKSHSGPGVPTLLLSDWHWGEVVDPLQVDGVNAYSLKIARQRTKVLLEHAIDLLMYHVVKPDFPGIVVPLGGDFFSGDIHEELKETNEKPMMPVIVDLYSQLTKALQVLADHFGRVFVPCVTGNHGRTSRKPQAKNRVFTNYDWLLYQLLEKYFEEDKRFTFAVSNGSDCYYRIFNHRYTLTHGDQFRGGDGLIGHIGPITRGDHKKRSRNTEIGRPYDTLLMGHFHTYMQTRRIITNGSLKGYDEYAAAGNFSFEPAQQALWLTHPQWGITFSLPVLVQREIHKTTPAWVSLGAA